ncbi:unnamed protein product [Cercopithifilaria johnstoni]|uniref:Matrix-remodeling-associated protein 7 helical domain-containing protein n=1 Tax=Cercopithifilaria johnstoni TaxID=2874296 RepID=A0A8J2M533_9BILA|nr:unnamed protein product [Cercopithifilaria johnstoni]
MRAFEDYDDSLLNPDTILHSLPPYNYTSFLQECPTICVVITALCVIAISLYFWRLFWIRQEEHLDNVVLNGRFGSSVLSKVQQRITTNKNTDATLKPLCDKESFKFEDNEPDEVVTSLNELYGKLATANLRAKAKKLEKAMTEEERKEEQLIQQKQLESICEMIMQEPEKFGFHDKSEVTEQMKLYSI